MEEGSCKRSKTGGVCGDLAKPRPIFFCRLAIMDGLTKYSPEDERFQKDGMKVSKVKHPQMGLQLAHVDLSDRDHVFRGDETAGKLGYPGTVSVIDSRSLFLIPKTFARGSGNRLMMLATALDWKRGMRSASRVDSRMSE